MPRNSSGTYTLPQSAFVSGTTISSSAMNSDLSDIATAMTQSLATTGVSSMTGPVKLAAGSAAAPSLTLATDTTTGWYNSAAGTWVFVSATHPVITLTNGTVTINAASFVVTAMSVTTLDVTGATTVVTLAASGAVTAATTLGVTGAFTASSTSRLTDAVTMGNASTPVIVATTGYVEFVEITAPAAGAANSARLYAYDDSTVTRVAYKDAGGTVYPIYPIATQAIQETGTSNTNLVTPGTQQYHPSSPKAWLLYNLSTSTLNASYGVSSVTHVATGIITVKFSVEFSSATSYMCTGMNMSTGANEYYPFLYTAASAVRTASACTFVWDKPGTGFFDLSAGMIAFWGDQ